MIAKILESIYVELRGKKNIISSKKYSKCLEKKKKREVLCVRRKEKVEDADNFFEIFKMFGKRERRRNIG